MQVIATAMNNCRNLGKSLVLLNGSTTIFGNLIPDSYKTQGKIQIFTIKVQKTKAQRTTC